MTATTTKKDESAERLIDWHFQVEPEMLEIYRIITPTEEEPGDPIRLLEVSNSTMPAGSVMTFGFRAAGDIYYPSVVAEITPDEMERIRTGDIPLPSGWRLETARRYARPARESTR